MTTLLAALTPRRVLMGCRALIVVQLALRLVVYGSGFFYWDDYVLQGRAARYALLSEEYLLYLHNGHLMPGGFLITGLLERLSPLDYWPVLITLLGLQAVATWLTYRLLRSLLGARPALLVLVAFLALAPATLLPGAWWSAAINFLPLQIGAALTGLMVLRAARGGRAWWLLGAVGVLVVALAFFEKSFLLPLIAVAVVIASGPPGVGLVAGIRDSLRRFSLYWLLAIPIVLAYLIYYLGRAAPESRPLFDSSGIVLLVTETVVRGLVPALWGGPLAYDATGFGTALADPPVLLAAICMAGAVALVAYGLIQSPRSRALWSIAGVWLLADLVTLVAGRSGFDMILAQGTSLRYTVDATVVLLLAAAITVAPPVGQQDSAAAQRLRSTLSTSLSRRPAAWTLGALAATAAFVVAATASHVTLVAPLADNASRLWLMNIRRAIIEKEGSIAVLDGPVPMQVYDSLGYPNNLLSRVLAPLDDDIFFTSVLAEPVMFNDEGELVPATVEGIESFPGPDGDCGWAVKQDPVAIPIDGDLFPWEYTLRLRYLAAGAGTVEVRLGKGKPVTVEVEEGPHVALLRVDGGGSRVTVGPYDGPEGICVAQVAVGDLVPETPREE